MNTKTKYLVIGLSIISAAGVGYFVYSKLKIYSLNKKISTLNQAYQSISQIDVSGVVIPPADITTEPEVPLYSGTSDEMLPDMYVLPPTNSLFDDFLYGPAPSNSYVDNQGTTIYTDHG